MAKDAGTRRLGLTDTAQGVVGDAHPGDPAGNDRDVLRASLIESHLERVIDRGLDSREISASLRRGGISRDAVREMALTSQEDILGPAEPVLARLVEAHAAGADEVKAALPVESAGDFAVAALREAARYPVACAFAVFVLLSVIVSQVAQTWSEDAKGLIAMISIALSVGSYFGAKALDRGIGSATRRRHEADTARLLGVWEQVLLDDGVLPVLRGVVNGLLPPPLRVVLDVAHAPDLARPADATKTVSTSSIRRFQAVARRMSGGAIGIAGPRGVGKSTLITHEVANDPAPVKLVVSAPVQYQARDFVLHLYAGLCGAVIDLVRPAATMAALRASRRRVAASAAVLALVAAMGAALASWARPGAITSPDTLTDAFRTDQVATITTVSAAFVTAAALVTIAVRVARLRWTRRRLLSSVGHAQLLTAVGLPARERLARIRLLQTTTTGWSGKLSLPASTEAGWTRTVQSSERALTYPEIVAELREFLASVVSAFRQGGGPDGVVLIAVDELDKIESAELAQQFLNEIKGVFGVDGTRFLVSVSDDALAAHERRGTAVRDAFDSAFDEIVRVEHLELADTRALLRSRVIGVSEPFLGLVHCLSGGLARDVIRVARSMIALGDETDPPGLEAVCAALVTEDLRRVTHGFQIAAGWIPDTADTTRYLRVVRSLRVDPRELLLAARDLEAIATGTSSAELSALARQSAAFAYHEATLLELSVVDPEISGGTAPLEPLADARQALRAHPRLAIIMIDDFRSARGFPLLVARPAE
ncbi:hypothetical protein [Amycolatopsis sp. lyj-346]|uniref:hypothetical protein n=1 Tax=Amycolatopsis sp. lyj-346 TaxID=2789289 RepID=UPI0039792381